MIDLTQEELINLKSALNEACDIASLWILMAPGYASPKEIAYRAKQLSKIEKLRKLSK